MSLEDTLANMSLYDAKKYFRRAQNVVFNYTEMEAKVREATNNEPWGASTTLMEQIAQGTYNLREREEILGMIFRRFTEKRANEWRQIYKALQLLDYLIKHGSERFIDDTRSSISLIRMLESFHYIDSQGRDQGINVRNRAKALAELLSDDEKIRNERKKARETAKKYKGVAGGSANQTGKLNARAGFNSTKVHGISISAESDEEEEEGISSGPPSTKPSSSNFADLLDSQESQATTPGRADAEDEDDDDEFAEFQSAAPPVQTTTTQTSQPYQAPAVTTLPTIVPAITVDPKRSDPFSSLFSTAVKASEPSKPAPSKGATKSLQSAPSVENNDDDEDDEDFFGEMTGAGAAEQQEQRDTNVKAGEVDLLSF